MGSVTISRISLIRQTYFFGEGRRLGVTHESCNDIIIKKLKYIHNIILRKKMASVSFMQTTNYATMTANTDYDLIDTSTSVASIVPAGSIIRSIWLRANSALTSGATLKIGFTGDNEAIIPAALSITTDDVNAADVEYAPSGPKSALGSNSSLVINPSITISSGQIFVYIEYNSYDDFT